MSFTGIDPENALELAGVAIQIADRADSWSTDIGQLIGWYELDGIDDDLPAVADSVHWSMLELADVCRRKAVDIQLAYFQSGLDPI